MYGFQGNTKRTERETRRRKARKNVPHFGRVSCLPEKRVKIAPVLQADYDYKCDDHMFLLDLYSCSSCQLHSFLTTIIKQKYKCLVRPMSLLYFIHLFIYMLIIFLHCMHVFTFKFLILIFIRRVHFQLTESYLFPLPMIKR